MRATWRNRFGALGVALATALTVAAAGCDAGDEQPKEPAAAAKPGSASKPGTGEPNIGKTNLPVPGFTKSAPYGMEDVDPTSSGEPGPKHLQFVK